MTTGSGLSAEALAALHEGRKIDAIKILRAERGLGLKEAKEEVDAYLRDHPELASMQQTGSALGCFAWIGLFAVVGYLLYKQFA